MQLNGYLTLLISRWKSFLNNIFLFNHSFREFRISFNWASNFISCFAAGFLEDNIIMTMKPSIHFTSWTLYMHVQKWILLHIFIGPKTSTISTHKQTSASKVKFRSCTSRGKILSGSRILMMFFWCIGEK